MTAKNGNVVKIHYCGKLKSGEIFDNSKQHDAPLQFTIGNQQVIPGFENGIIGMQIGEKKELHIPCEEAYGKRSDDYIIELPKTSLPPELNYEIGGMMQLTLAPEMAVSVEIVDIKDNSVVFDANHKLADKDLIFEVELLEIL